MKQKNNKEGGERAWQEWLNSDKARPFARQRETLGQNLRTLVEGDSDFNRRIVLHPLDRRIRQSRDVSGVSLKILVLYRMEIRKRSMTYIRDQARIRNFIIFILYCI